MTVTWGRNEPWSDQPQGCRGDEFLWVDLITAPEIAFARFLCTQLHTSSPDPHIIHSPLALFRNVSSNLVMPGKLRSKLPVLLHGSSMQQLCRLWTTADSGGPCNILQPPTIIPARLLEGCASALMDRHPQEIPVWAFLRHSWQIPS